MLIYLEDWWDGLKDKTEAAKATTAFAPKNTGSNISSIATQRDLFIRPSRDSKHSPFSNSTTHKTSFHFLASYGDFGTAALV